jgi:hypothetical protein
VFALLALQLLAVCHTGDRIPGRSAWGSPTTNRRPWTPEREQGGERTAFCSLLFACSLDSAGLFTRRISARNAHLDVVWLTCLRDQGAVRTVRRAARTIPHISRRANMIMRSRRRNRHGLRRCRCRRRVGLCNWRVWRMRRAQGLERISSQLALVNSCASSLAEERVGAVRSFRQHLPLGRVLHTPHFQRALLRANCARRLVRPRRLVSATLRSFAS